MPIQLQSGLEEFLAQCSAYDPLESTIAVVDTHGAVRYANQSFLLFNNTVRDSVQSLTQHETLLDCPDISSWLLTSLDTSHPAPLRHIFYYSPKIQVELTICLTCILNRAQKIVGALLTLGEESIAFDRRHLARSQDTYRTLVERIKVLDAQKMANQDLLNVLLKDTPVAMVMFNERREVVQLNRAAATLFKTDILEARGKRCDQILSCYEKSGCCQAINSHSDIKDEVIHIDVSGSTLSLLRSVAVPQKEGSNAMFIEAFVDVTERLAAEEKRIQYEKHLEQLNLKLEERVAARTAELNEALEKAYNANIAVAYMANHDELTGLMNRRHFAEELERWGKHFLRYKRPGLLMFIDLDNFKSINDIYGHQAGDEYLVAVSGLLKQSFRSTDYLGRWGGDEFIALLPETKTEQSFVIANKLLKCFGEKTINIAGHSMHASVSIGMAAMPEHTTSISELLDFADVAMFKAKEAGRGCCRLFTPSVKLCR